MKTEVVSRVTMSLCLQMIILSGYVPQASAEQRDDWFIPDTFFGSTTHVNREETGAMQLLDDLNMRTVRVNFPLSALAPASDRIDLSNFVTDSAHLGASLGLDQMAIVDSPAAWLGVGGSSVFPNDEYVQRFEDIMHTVATEFRGKVTNWEGPNEVHMASWGGPRYATMLQAFYRGVKRADPNNLVIVGTFDTSESGGLQTAYQHGIKDYFDVLNTHPYTWRDLPEEGGYVDKIEAVRNVMNQFGDDKPIWVSEIGYNGVEPSTFNGMPMLDYLRQTYPMHNARSTSEEDQARAYARLYLISASVPSVERVYIFGMGDLLMNGPIWGQPFHDEIEYMEVVGRSRDDTQLRPKPAFYSLRTVVEMIGETTYRGKIEMDSSRIWALKFQRDAEAIVALWSQDEDVTLPLQDASMIESVTSMVGSPILLSGNELHLSGRPIYLQVAAEDLASLQWQLAPLPGDYDRNGVVDLLDFDIWKQDFGSTTDLAADGNRNGVVDAYDYKNWRDNLGQSMASGTAADGNANGLIDPASVPEPGSQLLVGIGLAVVSGLRQTEAIPCGRTRSGRLGPKHLPHCGRRQRSVLHNQRP